MLFCSFFVKAPLFLFHVWLPKAHVESPTYLSVILASILLKLGVGGLAKLLFLSYSPSFFWFVVGLVVPCVLSFSSSDTKKVVAYSSVRHISFVVGGLFLFSSLSLSFSVGFIV